MSRTVKDIDQKTFENLLKIQCTERELCSVFDCTINTLKAWVRRTYGSKYTFQDISDRFRDVGKVSLRRLGLKHAERNAAAWIFQAKNYLGMSDIPVDKQKDVDDRISAKDSMAKAIETAAKAIKQQGMQDSDLADIPSVPDEALEYDDDIEVSEG